MKRLEKSARFLEKNWKNFEEILVEYENSYKNCEKTGQILKFSSKFRKIMKMLLSSRKILKNRKGNFEEILGKSENSYENYC